jgi:hypothetical protein
LDAIEVTFSGAFEAPYFVYGQTKNSEWVSTIRNHPAPWGELEIPNGLTISFPSKQMREVDDMEALGEVYSKILKYFVELMGTGKMQRHERLVFDIQINGGKNSLFILKYY